MFLSAWPKFILGHAGIEFNNEINMHYSIPQYWDLRKSANGSFKLGIPIYEKNNHFSTPAIYFTILMTQCTNLGTQKVP
jgi:hypothetical protein